MSRVTLWCSPKLKSKVSHSLTHSLNQWQGHLLSCPGQLNRDVWGSNFVFQGELGRVKRQFFGMGGWGSGKNLRASTGQRWNPCGDFFEWGKENVNLKEIFSLFEQMIMFRFVVVVIALSKTKQINYKLLWILLNSYTICSRRCNANNLDNQSWQPILTTNQIFVKSQKDHSLTEFPISKIQEMQAHLKRERHWERQRHRQTHTNTLQNFIL